jgi:GT2 family glycosyltransferase
VTEKNKNPLVSILVLNYNGMNFLKECFDSLKECNYSNFELVLIDNNSTDDSVVFIQENYPDVRIIQTLSNAGYSRAYNLAFREVKGKYLILLNNDVHVTPDWITRLVEVAEKDERIGALQPKIRSSIDDGYFEYAGASGGFIDKYGYPFLRGRIFYTIEEDTGQYDDMVDVFWTSGAAMFIRASALEKSGDLDETFVHHMEEIDLCWRLHLAGYRLRVVPQAVIYHYAGATIKSDSFKKLYWNHRNNIFMLIKNLQKQNLVKTVLARYLLDLINIMFSMIKLDVIHAYAIARAHVWLLTHLNMILRKRRVVQENRVTDDETYQHLIYQKSLIFDYFLFRRTVFTELSGFKVSN